MYTSCAGAQPHCVALRRPASPALFELRDAHRRCSDASVAQALHPGLQRQVDGRRDAHGDARFLRVPVREDVLDHLCVLHSLVDDTRNLLNLRTGKLSLRQSLTAL